MVAATGEAARNVGGAARLAILLATALLGFAAIFALAIRVTEPLAISPWESAIAMEGMRAKAGMPLYEAFHATHLYGPLLTVSLAGIFFLTGLNLLAARIVFCAVGVALSVVCTAIVCRGESRKYVGLVLAMFLAIGWRTNFINFCAQPDAAAALLAIIALVLWAKQRSMLRVAVALVLFVAAVFFKQTSAAFALIPLVHAAPDLVRKDWGRVMRSCVPALAVALALGAMRLLAPNVFHAMIIVPASLTIHWERAMPYTLFVLGSFPIMFLMIPAFSRRTESTEVERWSVAAAVVLLPLSVWTMLKSGGGYSSLFPGYLALLGVVAGRLPDMLRRNSLIDAVAVATGLIISMFFQIDKTLPLLSARAADDHYVDAVKIASELGPGVISPQDPTIAYRANGSFGPALFFELDTNSVHGDWPGTMPPNVANALNSARYVVQAESYVPVGTFEPALVAAGFQRADFPALSGSAYTIWEK